MIATIRQLPELYKNGLIHIVWSRTSRGYNGTDYITICRQRLTSGEKWATPQYDVPTCIACLGMHV